MMLQIYHMSTRVDDECRSKIWLRGPVHTLANLISELNVSKFLLYFLISKYNETVRITLLGLAPSSLTSNKIQVSLSIA